MGRHPRREGSFHAFDGLCSIHRSQVMGAMGFDCFFIAHKGQPKSIRLDAFFRNKLRGPRRIRTVSPGSGRKGFTGSFRKALSESVPESVSGKRPRIVLPGSVTVLVSAQKTVAALTRQSSESVFGKLSREVRGKCMESGRLRNRRSGPQCRPAVSGNREQGGARRRPLSPPHSPRLLRGIGAK